MQKLKLTGYGLLLLTILATGCSQKNPTSPEKSEPNQVSATGGTMMLMKYSVIFDTPQTNVTIRYYNPVLKIISTVVVSGTSWNTGFKCPVRNPAECIASLNIQYSIPPGAKSTSYITVNGIDVLYKYNHTGEISSNTVTFGGILFP